MLTIYRNPVVSAVKFHNNDVKIVKPYAEKDKVFDIIINEDNYIGELYEDNTVYLKFYYGSYILYYEDKYNRILDESEPIVCLQYDEGTKTGENSFNNDFGSNF